MIFFHKKKVEGTKNIVAPVKGICIDLENVDDPVFSAKTMGDGFAIQPENGKIYSPISGKITALFPSGHAIGIQGDNSVEVLIHIGIDTVNMNGDGFKKLVKNGDYVEAGKPIVQVNLGKVKKAGYDPIVMVILTGGCDKKVSTEMYGKSVEVGDTIIEIS